MKPLSYFIKNPSRILLFLLNHYGTWMSDEIFLKLKFRLEMGKKLNLKNPLTFQEKLQWLKLYDRKPEYVTMVDKYAVKDYVASRIGQEYIIPTLGVWDNFDEIDFDSLPNRFVLKTTHGGGSTGVVVCRDKSTLDCVDAKRKLENSLKHDIYKGMREWPYKNVPRRIIAEKFLELPEKDDLTDYKFFCFNGKPQYIQVIQDRNTCETIDFFDTEWNHQEFVGLNPNCKNAKIIPEKPKNLDDMVRVAEMLAKDTTFVRVDLYHIENRVYFGELTFYPASGFGKFTPDKCESQISKLLQLPNSQLIGGGKFIVSLNQGIIDKIDSNEIRDYKFFCFNGEPKFLKVDYDRFTNHKANYYDTNWNLLPFGEASFMPNPDKVIVQPPYFQKMVELATKLSAGHKFLRVDLYNIAGKIYFGELTFYPAAGFGPFAPQEWDYKVGELIEI